MSVTGVASLLSLFIWCYGYYLVAVDCAQLTFWRDEAQTDPTVALNWTVENTVLAFGSQNPCRDGNCWDIENNGKIIRDPVSTLGYSDIMFSFDIQIVDRHIHANHHQSHSKDDDHVVTAECQVFYKYMMASAQMSSWTYLASWFADTNRQPYKYHTLPSTCANNSAVAVMLINAGGRGDQLFVDKLWMHTTPDSSTAILTTIATLPPLITQPGDNDWVAFVDDEQGNNNNQGLGTSVRALYSYGQWWLSILIFGPLLGVSVIGFLLGMLISIWRHIQMKKKGGKRKALVTQKECVVSGHDSYYILKFKYKVNKVSYASESIINEHEANAIQEGDKVQILFDKSNPSASRMRDAPIFTFCTAFSIVLSVLFIGGILFLAAFVASVKSIELELAVVAIVLVIGIAFGIPVGIFGWKKGRTIGFFCGGKHLYHQL